jgi:hypothetical protein
MVFKSNMYPYAPTLRRRRLNNEETEATTGSTKLQHIAGSTIGDAVVIWQQYLPVIGAELLYFRLGSSPVLERSLYKKIR